MNPSLLLIPDRYKASKLYSQIPDSGAGDLAFTRALDTATRVGPDGLIEKVRTNEVPYSEQFDNAAWTKLQTSVTANTQIAPNGTTTADTLTEAAVVGNHIIFQNLTLTSGLSFTASVFAKNNGRVVQLTGTLSIFGSNAFANFDLVNGVLGTVGSAAKAQIEDVGNGWYRCSVTALATAGGSGLFSVGLVQTTTSARNQSYLGNGTSGAFLWGYQFESGDIATPYIPTTTAAVSVGMTQNIPRIDYTGGGCGKLLLEPQRQNLLTFSEQFNNAAWGKTQLNTTGTPPFINAATSPDGTTSAEKLIKTSATAESFASQTVSISVSGTYTFSAFFKYSGTQFVRFLTASSSSPFTNYGRVFFDILNGTVTDAQVGTAKVEDYGNGWYRCSMTYTNPSGGTFFRISPTTLGSSVVTAGNDIDAVLVWGCQAELGSFATSYIPTLGASVTRSADTAFKTGISALIGQTEGTLFVEVAAIIGEASTKRFAISDGTNVNRVIIAFTTAISVFVISSGVTVFGDSTGITSVTQRHKIAVAYKLNDFVVYVDGVQVLVGTAGDVPVSMSQFRFTDGNGGAPFQGTVNQALLFKTRLSNAQLEELTA